MLLPRIKLIKNYHQDVIYEALGLRHPAPAVAREIDKVDTRMLFTERRDLFSKTVEWGWSEEPYEETIYPWSVETSRGAFTGYYEYLRKGGA
jgi:hypothetical protein